MDVGALGPFFLSSNGMVTVLENLRHLVLLTTHCSNDKMPIKSGTPTSRFADVFHPVVTTFLRIIKWYLESNFLVSSHMITKGILTILFHVGKLKKGWNCKIFFGYWIGVKRQFKRITKTQYVKYLGSNPDHHSVHSLDSFRWLIFD